MNTGWIDFCVSSAAPNSAAITTIIKMKLPKWATAI